MRTDRGHFTRGAQVLETFGLMFVAGLKPMMWGLSALFLIMLAINWWTGMGEGDWYRCLMKVYAAIWGYVRLSPDKLVAVLDAGNHTVMVPVRYVDSIPSVIAAWQRFTGSIWGAFYVTLFGGLPLCLLYTIAANRIGRRVVRREHLRGASLCSGKELKVMVEEFNAAQGDSQLAAELEAKFGSLWRWHSLFARRHELAQADVYLPYTIAGIPYPWHGEQTHTFAIGTTGSGKSTAIKELVDQIRERHGKAVIFDLTGSFIQSYYDPSRDIILNSLDARCPAWSIFADCETRSEFTAAAEALVPNDGGTAEPFWVIAARTLLVEGCLRLKQMGLTSNQALHDYIMIAALPAVNRLVQNTIAAPLTDPEAARMAESIRSTLNTNAAALQTLPTEGAAFSVKRWVQEDQPDGSILFVGARYVDLPTVRILLTLWLDTAINSMMALPTSPHNIRLWFLFDELGALHRLPAIEKGMQTARNFGGAFLLGVHTISKLRETYGEKIADTLASLARTKIILATPDYASAQWCSQQIGQSEWQQMEQGLSYGYANVRDAVTLTNKRQTEPLVMPDQIMKMRDLEGWLVFPQDLPAGSIRLRFKARRNCAAPFIPRPGTDIAPADGVTPPAPAPPAEQTVAVPMFLPLVDAEGGSPEATGGSGAATPDGADGDAPASASDAAAEHARSNATEAGGLQPDIAAQLKNVADRALNTVARDAGLVGPSDSASHPKTPPIAANTQAERTSPRDAMKPVRVAAARGTSLGRKEVPHDPETGELLPEKAIRIEGVELNIVAGPAPPAATEQADDLTLTEARQNFTRDRGRDDFGW